MTTILNPQTGRHLIACHQHRRFPIEMSRPDRTELRLRSTRRIHPMSR